MAASRPLIVITNSDETFLDMMRELLRDEGYDALTVLENREVFSVIRTRMPQLVIVEMLLTDPEAGWSTLNKMRLDPETARIPIIVASTATDLIARNEAHLRAKGCAILLKPFDLEELLTLVSQFVPAGARD